MAKKMEDGQDYRNIQNIWLKNKDKIIANKIRPLIQNLDSIPFQDYDYRTHYIHDGKNIHKMDEGLLKKYTNGIYWTISIRGCPFGCSYCCNNALNKMYPHQNILRKRNADNIIKELMIVKIRLPMMKRIIFDDDDAFFMRTTEEIKEFSKKYKENIGLPLIITGASPLTLTREKLSLLVDAGLTFIRMGIQTGSERTKRLYKRHHSNKQVQEAVTIINEFKNKISIPHYDIILDNPWETEEDLIESLMLLVKFPKPYALTLFSLTFYPGTELYDMAKREGIITDDLKDVYRRNYAACKKTYLNRLFYLMNDYARGGGSVSPYMMYLLTDRKLRQLKLRWLLYYILKIGAIPYRVKCFKYLLHELYRVKCFKYLLHEGLKDIRRGDWSRMRNQVARLSYFI